MLADLRLSPSRDLDWALRFRIGHRLVHFFVGLVVRLWMAVTSVGSESLLVAEGDDIVGKVVLVRSRRRFLRGRSESREKAGKAGRCGRG